MPQVSSRRRSSSGAGPANALPVRERLLAAAMNIVQEEGIQGLRQARVAAAAGLRQSHLTYYFPTRKDLVKALMEVAHAEMKKAMGAEILAESGRTVTIEDVREHFAQGARTTILPRLMLALLNAVDEAPSLRGWLVEFDAELLKQLGEIFAQPGLPDVSEDDLALLHASLCGAVILGTQASIDPKAGADRAEHLVRLAFDRLIRATSSSPHHSARPSGMDTDTP
ncbi:MAG: hypothetical protein CMM50_16950 [Rhodospirillaceae bacterium]|nr:hypothetical protein [Rhodospirillaceae bacterium]